MNRLEPDSRYPIDLSSLPESWEAVWVGDASVGIRPGFASGKHNRNCDGIPHFRPMNIDRLGMIDLSNVKYVKPENPLRLSSGDVLFNNTNSPDLVGKTAPILDGSEVAYSNHMTRVRPADGISFRFMAHQLQYLWMTGYFKYRCVKHVNQASISSSTLSSTVPFLVAPSPEQSRIVAEIEKQFSRLDAGVAALRRVEANLKRYKASVLKAACTGRLTADWRAAHPDVEPAPKLLQRILTERRRRWEQIEHDRTVARGKLPKNDNWKKRYKEPVAFDPDIPRGRLPENWQWVTLGTLAPDVRDGPHHSPKYADNGVPFITGGHIRPEGVDFSKTKFISTKLHEEFCLRCKPEKGDMLYTKGGTTGIAKVNTVEREFSVWVHVAVLKLVSSISALYLQHALNSPVCYWQSQNYTHGVGNQDLGLTRMIKIAVPLPPIDEQEEIVTEIDRQMSLLNEIHLLVDHNLKRAGRLRQSILKDAFEGKLVEQDPADEPASVLLERIRAERAKASQTDGKAPRRRRKTVIKGKRK
ncbi:MAG: restriction endonuclease subunit S [Dehalococcoidia bacterium]